MSYQAFFIFLLCFFSLFILALLKSALRRLHKKESQKLFKEIGYLFPYRSFLNFFFPKYDYEEVLLSAFVTESFIRIAALISFAYLLYSKNFLDIPPFAILLILFLIAFLFYFLSDYIPRILGSRYPKQALTISAFIATPFLFLCFPVTFFFIKISLRFLKTLQIDYLTEPMSDVKHEIFEILEEAQGFTKLTSHDRKLIESVVYFQSRIAREVMVPRMDMFCLNAATSIKEAGEKLEEEGYSRVPVYKETIDNIVGVLMYKDILTKYMEYQNKNNDVSILEAPIESILKKVMYTPESKPLSNLLQDFRKKQVHLAIVVDEYGGTEGIVTIEDILEQIVGDIEDEYDEEEELFFPISNGWIVDGRMSILDIEEQLGISLPQGPDYDTLGGLIFHKAGAIPSRGFKLKLDNAELEIVKSNDRRVEKVKIKRGSLA